MFIGEGLNFWKITITGVTFTFVDRKKQGRTQIVFPHFSAPALQALVHSCFTGLPINRVYPFPRLVLADMLSLLVIVPWRFNLRRSVSFHHCPVSSHPKWRKEPQIHPNNQVFDVFLTLSCSAANHWVKQSIELYAADTKGSKGSSNTEGLLFANTTLWGRLVWGALIGGRPRKCWQLYL